MSIINNIIKNNVMSIKRRVVGPILMFYISQSQIDALYAFYDATNGEE